MDSNPLFVVAIDFGTTYSGYAYCSRHDYQQDPPKVLANENWAAGGQGLLSKKTPTCILLTPEKEFCAFGYEAEDEYNILAATKEHKDYYFFKRFKMKLHGEEDFDDDLKIEDELGKPLLAIEVFSKSIKYLKDHFMSCVDRTGKDIKDDEIRWILTVPAIWSDSAKFFMRKAAVNAGITAKQLKIALEPEAASIFCQHLKTERSTSDGLGSTPPGTKYMVIDIGGGTADITVHEKLEEEELREVSKASGGPWGGTAVDQQFIQLLTKIVGGPVWHKFQKESTYEYLDMMREFEVTKRRVDAGVPQGPAKSRATTNIKIPASLRTFCEKLNKESLESILASENFPYKSQIRIIGDKFLIDKAIMQGLFMKVINPITDHVQTILDTKEAKDVSIIILAGGFAESPLVQDVFKEKFKTQQRRVIVSEEAGLSVLKGAVMFGHRPDEIKARRLRYTYGLRVTENFIEGKHPESKKITFENKDYCEGIFEVFITQGALVEKGLKIKKLYNFPRSQKNKRFAIYCSPNTKPHYIDDKGCKLIRAINIGPLFPATKNEKYQIQVTYIFGDTEVEMEIRGKNFDFLYNDIFDYKEN